MNKFVKIFLFAYAFILAAQLFIVNYFSDLGKSFIGGDFIPPDPLLGELSLYIFNAVTIVALFCIGGLFTFKNKKGLVLLCIPLVISASLWSMYVENVQKLILITHSIQMKNDRSYAVSFRDYFHNDKRIGFWVDITTQNKNNDTDSIIEYSPYINLVNDKLLRGSLQNYTYGSLGYPIPTSFASPLSSCDKDANCHYLFVPYVIALTKEAYMPGNEAGICAQLTPLPLRKDPRDANTYLQQYDPNSAIINDSGGHGKEVSIVNFNYKEILSRTHEDFIDTSIATDTWNQIFARDFTVVARVGRKITSASDTFLPTVEMSGDGSSPDPKQIFKMPFPEDILRNAMLMPSCT
jgi:hypothetical protein